MNSTPILSSSTYRVEGARERVDGAGLKCVVVRRSMLPRNGIGEQTPRRKPMDDEAPIRRIRARLASPDLEPADPSTYLGYKECCVALGVALEDVEAPWGRFLQVNGLDDPNEWTQRHDLPRITGLIVNQTGKRQYWPGGDYFASNGRPDMDGEWWEQQARAATRIDWRPFL